jgi:hypothetical protein
MNGTPGDPSARGSRAASARDQYAQHMADSNGADRATVIPVSPYLRARDAGARWATFFDLFDPGRGGPGVSGCRV